MKKFLLPVISFFLFAHYADAAVADSIAPEAPEWAIDTAKVDKLDLNVHSTLFFQNNEFDTPIMRGYTLPGFRLCPTVSYTPSRNVSLELGIYMLRFWGTDAFPNLAYTDICEWTGGENEAKALHILPFFRAQMATDNGWNFVLGSIYGGRHHHLLEPLYAPELFFTADPEAGAQVLYSNGWTDLDMWVNWQSFIYKNDVHQEEFTFGLSSRFKYNSPKRRVHVYSPVQVLFQHRGGEIDTIYHNSVQTLMNAAAGVGTRIDLRHRTFRSLALEADALVYNQQVGDIWPFDSGWAYYLHGALDIAGAKATAGLFESRKFASLFGYPFFGGISTSNPGLTVDKYTTLSVGIDYEHEFLPGYVLGATGRFYHHLSCTGIEEGQERYFPASNSFYAALYIRISPSFLLKKLK